MPTRGSITKDTTLCISLAGRPSNLGTRFHNRLYEELGLDFVYKAFTTDDLEGAIRGVRALGIRGCSVSMPFKEAVIPLVDRMEASAAAIASVNTIVNDAGLLTAANTDFEAVRALLGRHAVPTDASVLVRGSGGMAKAVVAAFRDAGFDRLTVVARNAETGRALAEAYGYGFAPEPPGPADVLVNVTPIGMAGPHAEELAFDPALLGSARTVFDVVALPAETPLLRAAREAGVAVIPGTEVHAEQAARQFARYTGVAPTAEQVAAASAFARE
jgi:shikimate dehydrogenase